MNVEINVQPRCRGLFKIDAVNVHTGAVRELAPWQDNLITDGGLNQMGATSGFMDRCVVGSGNTAPSNGDTSLVAFVAGTSVVRSSTAGAQATAPYFGWFRRVFRFNAGTATGNLSELGLNSTGTNVNLYTRALIKDNLGNPTTITVLADEYLDVTYEIRQYPPLGDQNFNITIAGIVYAVLMRANLVTNAATWGQWIGFPAFPTTVFANGEGTRAYSAITSLGSISQGVTGTLIAGEASVTNLAYTTNSLQRDYTASWNVDGANAPGGIAGLHTSNSRGQYKMTFTPNIPKDNTKNLTFTFRVSWTRF